MILFVMAITALTALFAGLFILIQRNVVTGYRGALLIVMSGLYFSAVFTIAHFMQESFK